MVFSSAVDSDAAGASEAESSEAGSSEPALQLISKSNAIIIAISELSFLIFNLLLYSVELVNG